MTETRPMPEPPECWWYCTPPHGEPGLWTSDMDPAEYMPLTALDKKRLTDAECAAEYWRAQFDCEDYTLSDGYGDGIRTPWSGALWWPRDAMNNERRLATWQRFATRPHALEEA